MPVNTTMSTKSKVGIVRKAHSLFNFSNWSAGYFDIADNGQLIYRLPCDPTVQCALSDLVQMASTSGMQPPLLMRFTDILTDRVRYICRAFDLAAARHAYRAAHSIAYPIKVNQQRCVVEQITRSLPDRVGLEAGSKPELMAVLAQSFNKTRLDDLGTIICNGYKDSEYVRLALIGGLLGKRIFIVIEQPDELELVLTQARLLGATPLLGVRVRLTSIARGRWQNSGGEKSKFGLSSTQLLTLIDRLKELQHLDSLRLLHIHIGSQVPDLADVHAAINEASRYYQELHSLGAKIEVVDVGGGLGVDYEGTQSSQMFSINYSVEEYAAAIVESLARRCDLYRIPQPEIITECGRALTAHHAVLVAEVVDVERVDGKTETEVVHPLAGEIGRVRERITEISDAKQAAEVLRRCDDYVKTIHELYVQDELSLKERSGLDALIMRLQLQLQEKLQDVGEAENLKSVIDVRLADKFFCNFSVFQSTPDVWGIQQVFPVVPLNRLNEELNRKAVVHDLTCDSDGQISLYPVDHGTSATLPAHTLNKDERYYLGVFMLGAYQEILGDIHNLFGDTHAVNVTVDENNEFKLQDAEPGDRIDQLLEYLHYDSSKLLARYRQKLNQSKLSPEEQERYYRELAEGLSGYTYLEE